MPKFFIERPIFAWVIAIFVMLAGIVSITQLPISQYPSVAPPTIRVSATYPGATAQTLDENVLAVIEREMNGAEGLMYTEYTAQSNGRGELNVTFEPGTDPNLAQVDVQNRLARVEPGLPLTPWRETSSARDIVSTASVPSVGSKCGRSSRMASRGVASGGCVSSGSRGRRSRASCLRW